MRAQAAGSRGGETDFSDIAGQALALLPIPFLAFEPARHPDSGRDDLRIIWANPPAHERFGADIVGRWLDRDAPFGTMVSLVPEAALSRASARLRVAERAVERDGKTEHLRYTFIPVEQGAAIMVEDITAEVTARAELSVAGKTLAQVERWGNLGVWEVDLATGAVYWSTQVYEILGVDRGQLDAFFAAVHPDDLPLVEHVTQRLVEQPGPYRVTHRIVRGDEVRTVDQHMQSIADADGRPVRLLGTMIDVTETRALQQQVHHAQQMRAVGLLAGGLAHDFNNVLLVIRGHADLLLAQADPDAPTRSSLEAISRAGERASTLTRKLMALGRQDELRPIRVAPRRLLDDIADLVRPTLDSSVALEVEVDDDDTTELLVDVDQLHQVVIDLVLNARDAGAGTIRLRFETQQLRHGDPPCADGRVAAGTYGAIQVVDDGSGIDPATVQRIFEPFFTTKDAGSGSGLGLANARGFADRSLGTLLVDTQPGVGTTMSVLLPATTGRDAEAMSARRRTRRTRVLVAATDERCDQLVAALVDLDHQLVPVRDLEAMAFSLETEPIDLVVLDGALIAASGRPATLDGVPTVVVCDHPAGRGDEVPADDELALIDAVDRLVGDR